MKLYAKGKTKDVYKIDDKKFLLKFKDDMTGEDGVFDPGANTVGLTVEGIGKSSLRLSTYFFNKLEENGIKTHYISSDIDEATMTVYKVEPFKDGLEIILRDRAVGSFIRRYGKYAEEGQKLDNYVEITLKDDKRKDPLINKDALIQLGILKEGEYEKLRELMIKSVDLIKEELTKSNIELYDIKLEFGKIDGEIVVMDEISGGNMRAYKDGEYLEPFELEKIVLEGI